MARFMSSGLSRSEARTTGMEMARSYPEQMQRALEPSIPEYCECLLSDMRDKGKATESGGWQYNPAHRTAMQLIPQIMGVIGSQTDVLLAFLHRLGASSEQEAADGVRVLREAKQDPDDVASLNARPYLDWYYGVNGPGGERPEAEGYRAWSGTLSSATVEG